MHLRAAATAETCTRPKELPNGCTDREARASCSRLFVCGVPRGGAPQSHAAAPSRDPPDPPPAPPRCEISLKIATIRSIFVIDAHSLHSMRFSRSHDARRPASRRVRIPGGLRPFGVPAGAIRLKRLLRRFFLLTAFWAGATLLAVLPKSMCARARLRAQLFDAQKVVEATATRETRGDSRRTRTISSTKKEGGTDAPKRKFSSLLNLKRDLPRAIIRVDSQKVGRYSVPNLF